MAIQLVGAGVGRTGTHALKLALEQLLGGTCHHMHEVTPDQTETWDDAFKGKAVDWAGFLEPYSAIVDWPGAGVWRQTSAAFPDAPVLLSTRSSADVWYKSASDTIFASIDVLPADAAGAQGGFVLSMMASFCDEWKNEDAIKAAYEAHNQDVRDTIPADRLFEYQPGDGWAPLCAALKLPEPDMDFPHTNSTAEFQSRMKQRKRKRDS